MPLVITDFEGFEHGGTHGIVFTGGSGVSVVTTPAPQSSKETYTLFIPTSTNSSSNIVETKVAAEDDDFIWSCYVQFNFQGETFPSNAFTLFRGVTTDPSTCWRIRYDASANWLLLDADSTQVDSGGVTFVEDRYYRIDIWWQKGASGFVKVWKKDMVTNSRFQLFNETSMKTEAVGSADDVVWRFESFAQGGVSDDMTELYVPSYCMVTGATAESDIIGEFDVLGAYRADHNATNVPDWYPDNLSSGNWDDVFEVPFNAANFGRYNCANLVTKKGGMTCDAGSRPGPKGDTTIDGEPLSSKFLFAGNKPTKSQMWYLHGSNSDPSVAPTGRSSLGGVDSSGSRTRSYIANPGDTEFPRIHDDYFQMGVELRGRNTLFGSTVDGDIYDAAAFLLQKRKTEPTLIVLGDTSILGDATLAGG